MYMEQEYCIIYGSTEADPGPFILAVSKDQNLINGFREEHYQFCKAGEVVVDGFYDNLASDYEISYKSGHYMTPIMVTKFMEYLTSVYNQLFSIADVLERDLEHFIFTESEQEIIDDGFGLLMEHLQNMSYTMNVATPYDFDASDIIEDSVYGATLNIPECLDRFMATFEPDAGLY